MIDETKINTVVITVSDSRNEQDDLSGTTLVGLLISGEFNVLEKVIIQDDLELIISTLKSFSDRQDINLIITTGGTGIAARDNTPEATFAVIEKQLPGIAEAMRMETFKITPTAILSRGICGIRKKCLIINLPGSTKAVKECFEVIRLVIPHAVDQLIGNTKHI